MWESTEFGEYADQNLFVASDGSGGTPKCLRQVASGVATVSLCPLSDASFELHCTRFLGGQIPGRQTVPRAELWRAIPVLSRVDEKAHIQLPSGAMYVTKGVTHGCETEQKPNGDPWSTLFQLIDERTGPTDIFKVKSHWTLALQSPLQSSKRKSNTITCLQVLCQTLWPRRRLCDQSGTSVAKRLALVQAEMWPIREEAGKFHELAPVQELEVVTMQ